MVPPNHPRNCVGPEMLASQLDLEFADRMVTSTQHPGCGPIAPAEFRFCPELLELEQRQLPALLNSIPVGQIRRQSQAFIARGDGHFYLGG